MILVPFLIYFSCCFFIINLISLVYFRKNYLLLLLFLELMLLSVNYNFLLFSILLNDINGLIYMFYVLILAGIEASLGFSILILYNNYNLLSFNTYIYV